MSQINSKKSYEVFQAVETQATVLANYWDNFNIEIIQHLPECYHDEIYELSDNLETALKTLIDELRHPTLILATTGTTSSGKSTLVNFLCGADIVPTAVSEMSAGSVTIEYSENKALIIQETSGALWPCGEWNNVSDEEIYKRLEQTMFSYIDNKKEQANLAYPQFIIYYPFRLFKEYERDLPRGVKVKLLDLPGLSYVGDDSNMEVIKQCRDALCLVTYNSQETDPLKVKSLLSQVVEEVKGLGGSPERMLFILNKIDVFRNDKNWEESEKRFVEKTTRSIKIELTEQLREYTKAIEALKIIKLSTLPALLALQIQSNDNNNSTVACKDADRKCNQLIEETLLEDLPRKAENWSIHDRSRVAEDLWRKSYAEEFQQYLNQHITQYFPKLIIPQAIEKFNVAAGNSIARWAVQTTTAILNSSEENYKKECEKTSWIKSFLYQFIEISDANLRKPFEKINQKWEEYISQQTEDDPLYMLSESIIEFQGTEPYKTIEEKLIPLYDWINALKKGVDEILEAVAGSLESGIVSLDHPNFRKADIVYVNLLESNLKRLVKLSYSYSAATYGENVVAKTEQEKSNLQQKNQELNLLSIHLSLIIGQVLDQTSKQEINRIYEAVNELFIYHLGYLEKESNSIAQDIVIRFPESELIQVKKELKFDFVKFNSDFEIKEEEYLDKHRTWKHWLWLVPKKETYFSDNAKIPSIGEFLAEWKKQLKQIEPDILKEVMDWLLAQINELKKNVDKTQSDILNLYIDRLEKARREIEIDYEKQKNVWVPLQQRAKALEAELFKLENIWK